MNAVGQPSDGCGGQVHLVIPRPCENGCVCCSPLENLERVGGCRGVSMVRPLLRQVTVDSRH